MGIRIMMGCSTGGCDGRLTFTPKSRRSATDAPTATCPECGRIFGLFAGDVIPLIPADAARVPSDHPTRPTQPA